MSTPEATHGLTCPNCGGVVPIPEGQSIVCCPYCDMRSFVRGERGLLRYQIPLVTTREKAIEALQQFFRSNLAIARDLRFGGQVQEAFLVYLPFWTVWSRAAAWVFGQKRVGSGDSARYEPREIRVVQEMTWNGAACDVGEFGVYGVPITGEAGLAPFNADALHASGMVFEPVSSFSNAREAAEERFQDQVRSKAGLDRLSQLFVRFFRRHYGMVYYPLWVLRYLYRGRSFQVVVDGNSGKVLYGKAPGNIMYRAAVLVAGMALGAIVAIDIPALILSGSSDNSGGAAIALFLAGLGIMAAAYRTFRRGEQYEYRSGPARQLTSPQTIGDLAEPLKSLPPELAGLSTIRIKDVEKWIDLLN